MIHILPSVHLCTDRQDLVPHQKHERSAAPVDGVAAPTGCTDSWHSLHMSRAMREWIFHLCSSQTDPWNSSLCFRQKCTDIKINNTALQHQPFCIHLTTSASSKLQFFTSCFNTISSFLVCPHLSHARWSGGCRICFYHCKCVCPQPVGNHGDRSSGTLQQSCDKTGCICWLGHHHTHQSLKKKSAVRWSQWQRLTCKNLLRQFLWHTWHH